MHCVGNHANHLGVNIRSISGLGPKLDLLRCSRLVSGQRISEVANPLYRPSAHNVESSRSACRFLQNERQLGARNELAGCFGFLFALGRLWRKLQLVFSSRMKSGDSRPQYLYRRSYIDPKEEPFFCWTIQHAQFRLQKRFEVTDLVLHHASINLPTQA